MILSIVILAAGQGKRMCSALPKVLHPLGGKSLLTHVIDTAQSLNPQAIYVVYGCGGEQVKNQLAHLPVQWIEQTQQLGTGHAVLQAIPQIPDDHQVLIMLGDIPLISHSTLQKFLKHTEKNSIGLMTVHMPDPAGFGRIVRDKQNKVIGIVEEKDATAEQVKIQEINSYPILAPAGHLKSWLAAINNHNVQGEYYLPDIVPMAVKENIAITTTAAASVEEVQGVNDRAQLALLERYYQKQLAQQLMLSGVTLKDPTRFDARGELTIAQDVIIDINVILENKIVIGSGSYIGPNCLLRDVIIGNNVVIKANSVIEEAAIGDDCVIGPFARVRPGTHLAQEVHIGNFVEVKKSKIGKGSKINHLSYIGDATVGEAVNIGAGTITCNYDGVNKHQTIIGDGASIGSDTQLIAPVTIGEGATIGAGSTIVRDAPAGALTLSRVKQQTIDGWKSKRGK
jgi:bifunctional UDP-N-acetylglucosamine pyrophosphorylase/glucosamine-1-phosphate N-acetyltransferase